MENLEKKFSGAERRRIRAEDEGELSISHWLGELHSHTGRRLTHPQTPEEEIAQRQGSNCGTIPLEILSRYHAEEMLNQYIAITNHSRDADPKNAVIGVTEWFKGMYLNNENWLSEHFKKAKDKLTDADLDAIEEKARHNAEQLILYKDERLEAVLGEIDSISENNQLPLRVFKGVEVSLLPDGTIDSPMVSEGKFESVNCSIHPKVDIEKFTPILKDPKKYTDLILKGITHPKTNIISHIGYGADKDFTDRLDWNKIAAAARENSVAVEINLKELMEYIYDEILNYDKHPKSDNSYLDTFRDKLPELIPIISSEKIRRMLKPHIQTGLKIAINSDEHKSKFIETKIDKENIEVEFKERDFRFWRCLKIVENYFNRLFKDLGVKQENIINTFPVEKLEHFLKKET